ncbi:alpha-amylase family glycosyl hydrolase [Candidatus Mycoplasma pogonae]
MKTNVKQKNIFDFYNDKETQKINFKLGIEYKNNQYDFYFWQPIAQKVELVVNDQQEKQTFVFQMKKNKNNVWKTKLTKKYTDWYYQYRITHQDGSVTQILDPYAKATAPFNWEGQTEKHPWGIIFDENSPKLKYQKITLENNSKIMPLIYELNIRDFSFRNVAGKKLIGTFNSAIQNKIFEYAKKIGVNYIQLLPLQATYSLDDTKQEYLDYGMGKGWSTNYNWGYDPYNYFSLNKIYTENPQDHYAVIKEFKKFVAKAHKKGIGIIVDVVYNHVMTNMLFDDILKNYYFRDSAKVTPVDSPPLDSTKKHVRKLIIDSLKYWVEQYDVDGFRFDLSCFLDKETLDEVYKELKKIKKGLILHGEAWPFSDLKYEQSYIKGVNAAKWNFGYFNDSIRNAIKGVDEIENLQNGLVVEYSKANFDAFLQSIPGNIKWDFSNIKNYKVKTNVYHQFSNSPKMTLQYLSCHDDFTLWDKLNITSEKTNFEEMLEIYRQALITQITSQGKHLFLAGTELLQSKPTDGSGQDWDKSINIPVEKDFFNENKNDLGFNKNTYKTTDYVNQVKFQHLENKLVKKYIFNFFKKLLAFKKRYLHFNFQTAEQIYKHLRFIKIQPGYVEFEISYKTITFVIIHNFINKEFAKNLTEYKVFFNSKLSKFNSKKVLAKQSLILEKK